MKIHLTISTLFLLSFLSIFEGCGGCPYSFSGSSVPPHLKTIAVPYADDKSGSGEAGLRETFTQKLTQKFIDDNSLRISERNTADAILETTITSFGTAPSVITSGSTVSSRRVTITVSAVFRDMVKKKVIYEKQFSNYGDYDTSLGNDAKDAAIKKAIDNITEDILIDTISGW